MMLKKSLTYILIFILLCSTSNYSIDYVLGKQIEKQSPYYLSFASIGAIYLESRLDCWAKIRTSSSQQELQDHLCQILQSLDLVLDQKHLNISSTEHATILNYKQEKPKQNLFITIKSDNRLNESYFLLSIICRDKKCVISGYESQLNRNIGLKWQYYYLYQGEIPYLIAEKSKPELISVVLKNLQARKIESYKHNGLVSLTAYSPVLEKTMPALELNGKKYNLQVAISNNNDKAKTEIYIGSPLILVDI
jgi:hypothetical protein